MNGGGVYASTKELVIAYNCRESNQQAYTQIATTNSTASKKMSSRHQLAPNAKCAVCNDDASGFHYGVDSCEGCKVSIVSNNCNVATHVCLLRNLSVYSAVCMTSLPNYTEKIT